MNRYLLSVLSIEVRRILSYRVDFWLQFLIGTIAQVVLAYFLWQAIYEYNETDSMQGYSLSGMVLYYIFVPLIDRMVRGSEMSFLSNDIYNGTLNRYLVFPVSVFHFKFVSHLGFSLVYSLQMLLAISMYFLWIGSPVEFSPSIISFFSGFCIVFFASYMFFVMAATLEIIAFWADNVWSLLVLLRFLIYLFGGGMIPLAFFPEWTEGLLTYLPFAYFISFPIQTFLGQSSLFDIIEAAGIIFFWSIFLTVLYHIVWRRGMLRYTGVGI